MAVASADWAGDGVSVIILNQNLTSHHTKDHFFMVGQNDASRRVTKVRRETVKAQLKLLYSNDPLFTFVPENEVVEVEVTKLIYPSTLKSSETGAMDGTGYTPKTAIPKLNVTAARGIDYTTSDGGVATLLVSLTEQPTGIVNSIWEQSRLL